MKLTFIINKCKSTINVYDLFNVNGQEIEIAKQNVLSETVTDIVSDTLDLDGKTYFAVEFLPGQYDQRADSAIQCIQLLTGNDEVRVKSGKVIILEWNRSEVEIEKIKQYYINPIEMREKDLQAPLSFDENVANCKMFQLMKDLSIIVMNY